MPSGQDLPERLAAEARRTLESYIAASEADAENLQTLVTSLLERFRVRARSLTQLECSIDKIVGDTMTRAVQPAEDAALRAREALDFVARFSRELRGKETQEEILGHLLDGSARFASAVALLAVHGDRLDGWASRGLAAPVEPKVRGCSIEQNQTPWLAGTLAGAEAVETSSLEGEPQLNSLLEQEARGIWVALPLRVLDKPAAVVIARGASDEAPDTRALTLLIDLTALCLENIALRIIGEAQAGAEPALEAPAETVAEAVAEAAPSATPPEEPGVEPLAPVEQVVELETVVSHIARPPEVPVFTAESVASQRVTVEAAAGSPETPAEAVEPPAESEAPPFATVEPGIGYASVQAESVAEESVPAAAGVEVEAVTDGRIVAEPPAVPSEDASVGELNRTLEAIRRTLHNIEVEALQSGQSAAVEPPAAPEPPAPLPGPVSLPVPPPAEPSRPAPAAIPVLHSSSEEEQLHTDAKRFARLLVSEIKLYNEQHVAEGRANRDVYVRLKRDIDRSRDMYEKRVAQVVSRKVDYFHDEIIRILGDNDPSALGSDYPGSRAES